MLAINSNKLSEEHKFGHRKREKRCINCDKDLDNGNDLKKHNGDLIS